MNQADLAALIREAFRGVRLGGGVSLQQSRVQDNWGRDESGNEMGEQKWRALPQREVTEDWEAIPTQVLNDSWSFSHLVEEGFRYYLPAFMIHLLGNYSDCQAAHSFLFSLCPKRDQLWDYYMLRYSLLSEQQRFAVAHFLISLPDIAELDEYERRDVARALNNYWKQYL